MTSAQRRRGPARSLTRDQVVDAALAVMREAGLDAVSFRSVSKQLGVNPMALYTYVADKEALLVAMFDEVLRTVVDALPTGATRPQEALIAYFRATFRLMTEHADLYRLARPTAVGLDFDRTEQVYRMLADLGVADSRIADVHLALIELTVGSALSISTLAAAPATAFEPPDPEAHPLSAAVAGRAHELDHEEHFVRTFRVLLDALVMVNRAEGPP